MNAKFIFFAVDIVSVLHSFLSVAKLINSAPHTLDQKYLNSITEATTKCFVYCSMKFKVETIDLHST